MNFRQKLQYKARAYLYEWEQKKASQKEFKKNGSNVLEEIMEGLDEIEDYLEEKVEEYKQKTKRPY